MNATRTDWFYHAKWGVFIHFLGVPPSSQGGSEAPRSKPRGIFAEPCDLSSEAIRAKEEAKSCGSLLRRSKASGCEGREPQGFLAKKGKKFPGQFGQAYLDVISI